MGVKKIPMRMCTGCREMKPKMELVRIVKTCVGDIKLDATGKLNGRGAYICPNLECLNKVIKSKRLERSLETTISQEIYESLKEQLT